MVSGGTGYLPPVTEQAKKKKRKAALRLAIIPAMLVVAVLLAWHFGYFDLDSRTELFERIQRLRRVNGIEIGFAVAVAVAIALCLPLNVMTILGGALFGAIWGAALTMSGALCGTLISYNLARSVGRKPLRRLFGDHTLLSRLGDHDSVAELLRLRVLPIAPFGVLDYLSGLSGVSLKRLLLATAMGSSLSIVAYSFVGDAVFDGLTSQRQAAGLSIWIAVGVTVLMTGLSLVPRLFRRDR